jgi:hypothetical protein
MTFLIIRITLTQICNKNSSIYRSSFEFYTYFAILESLYKSIVVILKLFTVHIMFYKSFCSNYKVFNGVRIHIIIFKSYFKIVND